jgi:cobalt transporter subunit CbtB
MTREPGDLPAATGRRAHLQREHGGCHMNSTSVSAVSGLSVSQRLTAGLFSLALGFVLLGTIGFAQDVRLHNGAHDTRHALGFPCH